MDGLRCAIEPSADRVILHVCGEIDLAVHDQWASCLDEALKADTARLQIDFSSVAYIDSRGVQMLSHAQQRALSSNCALTVIDVTGVTRRVFEIMGLSYLLEDPD